MGRVADLTWERPKLVLALVGVLAVVAAGFGHDVQKHLKAAGFTDSASQSEQAPAIPRHAIGSDPNPGIVILVRQRDNRQLDLASPTVRTAVDEAASQLEQARYVGRVINPLGHDPAARALRARDGR